MYTQQAARLAPDVCGTLAALSQRVDLSPGPGGSRITPAGAVEGECRAVIGDLLGAWARAMFVVLEPSAQLVAHCDPPIPGQRFHVPLIVNPGCWVFHAGVWRQLAVGWVYEMNPAESHGAVNWGAERRLHLIIDTCPRSQ